MRIKICPKATTMQCAHHLGLDVVPKGHKCNNDHGHSYKVLAHVSCDARCFDPDECSKEGLAAPVHWVMDYGVLLAAIKSEVYDALDHSNLNKTLKHSTTEHLCRWIWPRIEKHIPPHARLDEIEVHEGEHVCRLSRY